MKTFVSLVVAVALAAAAFWGWHFEYGSERTVTFTISRLDDQSTGSGHQYLVFTTAGKVYKNTDSVLHGKTDSSDVQARFQAGQTWRCPVYGYRVFVLSSYPDILDGCKLLHR